MPGNDKNTKFQALAANFIQGIRLIEIAILEGYYLQAGALLRQEMEIIAQIEGIRKDKYREGENPNINLRFLVISYGIEDEPYRCCD
jgi:hypothetical protein